MLGGQFLDRWVLKRVTPLVGIREYPGNPQASEHLVRFGGDDDRERSRKLTVSRAREQCSPNGSGIDHTATMISGTAQNVQSRIILSVSPAHVERYLSNNDRMSCAVAGAVHSPSDTVLAGSRQGHARGRDRWRCCGGGAAPQIPEVQEPGSVGLIIEVSFARERLGS